jgi:dUTP pyrophosphatase
MSIKVAIINKSANELPAYASVGASGLDVRANIAAPITLESLERTLIPTGIYLEIPVGYEAQVRPRSGLAIKQGITCLNTPGTIDSDYRGEVMVIMVNLSKDAQTINPGERVAQLVFMQIVQASWVAADALSETARGEGGFGSTGKN